MAVQMISPGIMGVIGRHDPRFLYQSAPEQIPLNRRLYPNPTEFGYPYDFEDPGNLFSTTIKMNSSYLELTDSCYNQRGYTPL